MHPLGTLKHTAVSAHSNGPISMFFNGKHVANTKHKLRHNVLSNTVFKMQICVVESLRLLFSTF